MTSLLEGSQIVPISDISHSVVHTVTAESIQILDANLLPTNETIKILVEWHSVCGCRYLIGTYNVIFTQPYHTIPNHVNIYKDCVHSCT